MSIPNITAGLASSGKGKGTEYTTAEKAVARHTIVGLLVAVGHIPEDDPKVADVPEEIIEAIKTVATDPDNDGLGVPNLARRVFNKVVSAHFDEDDTPLNEDDFPKKRDYTSIGLIFRGQTKGLVDSATLDGMFPSYYKKKSKKSVS